MRGIFNNSTPACRFTRRRRAGRPSGLVGLMAVTTGFTGGYLKFNPFGV